MSFAIGAMSIGKPSLGQLNPGDLNECAVDQDPKLAAQTCRHMVSAYLDPGKLDSWLTVEGLLLANLDLANLRLTDGRPLARRIAKRFRDCGSRTTGGGESFHAWAQSRCRLVTDMLARMIKLVQIIGAVA